ncbi:transposable element Tc1 transposase [Trichonephila clavipes]|nr:transposable element Tc1 transposase [Trichonephila clavipes]
MSSPRETTESERLLVVKWSIGSVAYIPGREHKEILSTTAKRKIIHSVKKDPKVSASKLALSMSSTIREKISDETIRRNLHQYGFHGHTPIRKPLINDGRFKIWREAGKALAPKNTIKTVKFRDGSVLVWGCMSSGGVGELAFIDGIIDKHVYLGILKGNLEKSASKVGLGSGFIFQQDNNPKHTAKIVQLHLLYHCWKQLNTPDLNVIENLWLQLEKVVHEHTITSKEVLKKVPREEWAKLSVETTKTLVESMPKRLQAVIQTKAVWGLECYVCDSQDSNYDKCIKTIKTCDIAEDRCLSEVRWGSTPYWDSTGKKQFYISKTCSTERQCKDSISAVSSRCDRIWYNDWECVECCHGDRCNYYVTLAGVNIKPHGIFYILVTVVWLLVLTKVL